MTASEIAAALGPAHRSGAWWRSSCPVHGSKGASLALRDDGRRLVVHCHAGCSPAAVRAELSRRGLFDPEASGSSAIPNPAEMICRRKSDTRDRQQRIALAQDIIKSGRSATATVVERYLQKRIPGLARVPSVIRYLPMSDPYARHIPSGARRPVMVTVVEHVEHGAIGAHRTWLAVDGSAKASVDPVRMSTGPVGGGAIRLGPAGETLMVGEGVETCLAVMQATAFPAWAALSTSGLRTLVLPPIVREVVILADNDASGAGKAAAHDAAQRWLLQGRRVKIAMPPEPGTDFNDILLGRSLARIQEVHDVAA